MYLHPEDSAAAQCEKDECHGVALSWSEKRDNIILLLVLTPEKGQTAQCGREARFQHLETMNSSIPKRQETAFNLLLINLQISWLAHKEHHALIKPSCFMGRATTKSVDFWY